MQPQRRRQVIQTLRLAAAALLDVETPRTTKRRKKKPRETPRFKTTDETLEYAMRHKGERDVPALGIRYRGDTSDSEVPDTFGRVWAAARRGDIQRLIQVLQDVERLKAAREQVHEPSSPDDAKEIDDEIEELLTEAEEILGRLHPAG